ncbi:MAG: RidA family protein [Acetobacteraceae bacterium]|nr:RidA family protein [Acetobacteraceae bacterium]
MPHQRFRRFDTAPWYPGQGIADEMCMAVRAGNLVFLRGQTGFTLEGDFVGLGDAAAQAEQAMTNVKLLLEEAGSAMEHICKITTCVTDRAFGPDVRRVIGRHLGHVAPVGTGLIVNGLARPEMLVGIDIDAVIP